MNKKVIKKIIIILILLGLAGAGGYYGWRYWQNRKQAILEKSEKSPDKLFTVKRGDLPIGVLLTGSINTRVKHKLFLEVPLSTKLVAVVDENEKVYIQLIYFTVQQKLTQHCKSTTLQ